MMNEARYAWDEKALELLQAMEKVNSSSRRHKRMVNIVEDEKTQEEAPAAVPGTSIGMGQ